MRVQVSRCLLAACSLLLCSAAAPGARTQQPDYYPLRPGNWWLYQGPARVSWDLGPAERGASGTSLAKDGTASGNLRVRVEVTGVEKLRSGMTLVLLRQTAAPVEPCPYPREAFADLFPPERTCACLWFRAKRAYYQIGEDLAQALRAPTRLSAEDRQLLRVVTEEALPQFVFPLRDGQRFADKTALERYDDHYQWIVSKAEHETVRGTRYDEAYVLRLQTVPDDSTVHFVPHLGVTRQAYRHHGTIVEWDWRLVDFRVE